MKVIVDVENWMAEAFKSAPQLSKRTKELFVQAWPWLALLFGGLQILSLFGAWDVIREVQRREAFLNFLGATNYDGVSIAVMYASFALSIVSAVMLLVAYAPLRVRARRGWQLLFIVVLVNALSGLLALFIYGQGVGIAVLNLVVVAIVLYLLMQIRNEYKREPLNSKRNSSHASKKPKK